MNTNNQAFTDFPRDPFMLLSMINSKLRDFYPTFDSLCEDMNLDKSIIMKNLNDAGFEYSEEFNKFW